MINIGFIGSGKIAGHHFLSIKKYKNLRLKAVSDFNLEKISKHNFPSYVKKYDHYEKMLANEDLDLVVLMTPSGMHYEHTKKILQRYNVNIIVEKPICLRTSQVIELYSLARKKKLNIFPVYQNRYNKCVKFFKKKKTLDQLGKIRLVSVQVRWCRPQRYYDLADWRGTFSHDGGALTNQGIHHLDVLRYVCGEITKVNTSMRTLGANIEVEDTVVSTIEFKNGAVGTLEITTAARPKDFNATISIVGSKGLAQIGGIALNELQIFTPNESECNKNSEYIPNAYGFGHFSFYKDISKFFSQKKKFPVTYKDCLNTINLLNAFYISDEINKSYKIKGFKNSKRLGKKNEKISKNYK